MSIRMWATLIPDHLIWLKKLLPITTKTITPSADATFAGFGDIQNSKYGNVTSPGIHAFEKANSKRPT